MVAQLDSDFVMARPGKAVSRLLAYILFEGRPVTAKGRWINPLVFLGHRAWRILPGGRRADAPIYVLGQGRSGTTLLGKVLGMHRDLAFLNEPKALWQSALEDDDLIGSYSAEPGRYRMGAEDATPAKVGRLRKSYAAYAMLSRSARVVDKYPELIFRYEFLRKAFPGARVIIITRDGRQAAASVANWSATHASTAHNADWWGVGDRKWNALVDQVLMQDTALCALWPIAHQLHRQEDRAAVEWILTAREALLLKELHGRDIMLLPFEHLANSPRRALSDIQRFCGLSEDEVLVRYGARVIRPVKDYPAPDLHPFVQRELDKALTLMGYLETGSA